MKKRKSIVVLSFIAVFIILMAVFALVEFPVGLYDYTGYAKTIKLGLDLSGGVSAVFEVKDDGAENLEARIDGTVASLQSLLVAKGYTEAVVSYSNDKIRVEVPDVDDPEKVFELIGRPASLEFRDSDGKVLIVGRDHIENAYVTQDNSANYAVGLKFNKVGAEKFSSVTSEYTGKTLYVFVNNEEYTQVSVNEAITGGSAIITNSSGYTYEQAYDFVTQVQSGTFAVELLNTETRTISPTLGSDAIRSAVIAGAIGIALVFIFMALTYRMLGVAADIALVIYVLLLLWFCAALPWVQLTLPGIAGIVLGIGMAVDANIVIFERIKDEYKMTNKPFPSAVKNGFKRSMSAIIDGNVTTLIGAIVLWVVGSASIAGFAITLFISIIISMASALFITRVILSCFIAFSYTDKNPKKNSKRASYNREELYEYKVKLNEKLYGVKRKSADEINEVSFALASTSSNVMVDASESGEVLDEKE